MLSEIVRAALEVPKSIDILLKTMLMYAIAPLIGAFLGGEIEELGRNSHRPLEAYNATQLEKFDFKTVRRRVFKHSESALHFATDL